LNLADLHGIQPAGGKRRYLRVGRWPEPGRPRLTGQDDDLAWKGGMMAVMWAAQRRRASWRIGPAMLSRS
jgi:hypothetical protein